MLHLVYAATATLAAPFLRRMLAARVRRGKEIAARLPEREGIEAMPRPSSPLLWLHAASVGETMSILPVLSALHRLSGELRVLMTTGTVTSAAMLAQRLPELGLRDVVLHRFVPLDVPAWVERFLNHWRPDAAGFVESEMWPSLLAGCAAHRMPVMLVNARMSGRSFSRWRRVPGLARRLFGGLRCVQAQSGADARRLRALGAPVEMSVGNLKFAAAALPFDAAELDRLQAVLDGRPVWLAASIHPGEDAAMLAVHDQLARAHPRLLTILVPRHPERGAAIVASAAARRVTRRGAGEGPPAEAGIWVADTLGELGLFYRLVGHAFVGRSLGEKGGQNPLEPARLGCAVAVGPDVANFAEPTELLEAAGALSRVADAAGLAAWVETMFADPAKRAAMGQAGKAAAAAQADLPEHVAKMLLVLVRG